MLDVAESNSARVLVGCKPIMCLAAISYAYLLMGGAQPAIPPNLYIFINIIAYWAALSLSFRLISILMLMNIIAWGPQVNNSLWSAQVTICLTTRVVTQAIRLLTWNRALRIKWL